MYLTLVATIRMHLKFQKKIRLEMLGSSGQQQCAPEEWKAGQCWKNVIGGGFWGF
jgi:hypothetical protein